MSSNNISVGNSSGVNGDVVGGAKTVNQFVRGDDAESRLARIEGVLMDDRMGNRGLASEVRDMSKELTRLTNKVADMSGEFDHRFDVLVRWLIAVAVVEPVVLLLAYRWLS